MNRKRVLYVITKGNWGGAQRYVFDLATNLSKEDFEVAVALGEGKNLEEKLQQAGIKTIRLKNSQRNINPFKDLLLFFELWNLYKKEKPDVIHLNSSKIGLLGSLSSKFYSHLKLTAKSYKLKAIFTAHGWAFNDSKFWLSKMFWKFLQWLTVLLTDKTIAVSEKTKLDMNWSLAGKKIEVIYNGLEPPNFLSKEEARERLLPGEKDKFWIGTISELHKNKGLDILIESCELILKKHPETKILVLGEGEERKFLEKKIKEKNISSNFILVGHFKNASKYLKAFDIFVLPSRTEGLPYALLEAGLAGLPCLASKVGGIPEIISENQNGLLATAGDKNSIKQKLEILIENKELREKLGKNLERTVVEKFDLKNMVELTLNIY